MSHMILGHTTPMPRMIGLLGKYGFNVPKASFHGSAAYGSAHSRGEVRATWHGATEQGVAAHEPDVRAALGRVSVLHDTEPQTLVERNVARRTRLEDDRCVALACPLESELRTSRKIPPAPIHSWQARSG